MFDIIFLLTLLCQCGNLQATSPKSLARIYETNLNSSLRLEKEDRRLRSSWLVDLQLSRINVTTEYRLRMNRHKEHCFQGIRGNEKWTQCLYHNRRLIRKSTKQYVTNESECLATSTSEDDVRTRGVDQIEKEMHKWRKGYKYLVNTCKTENPGDEVRARQCLIQFMEKDNYNTVIERLILLKLEAMGQLYLQIANSIKHLDTCLREQFSAYLETVRSTMEVLNKCYNGTRT